jgi:hypothetical protein
MPGDGAEAMMVAAPVQDLALPAHQVTALVPMDRQAQDLVKALQASRFPSVVTSRKPNAL